MEQLHVILHFDGLRLLLPQQDIISVEVSEDLLPLRDDETDAQQAGIVGWVYLERQQNPVYCLSTDLTLQQNIPTQHEVIVVLQIKQGLFGLSCERIEPLSQHQQLHSVPVCMQRKQSPVSHLVIHQNSIAHLVNAEEMANYLFP